MKNVTPLYPLVFILLGLVFMISLESCLIITSITAPDEAAAGEIITAQVRVKSDLNRAAGEPIAWNLFLSADPYFDREDIALSSTVSYAGIELASYLDLSASFMVPINVADGEYYLISIANETSVDEPARWGVYNLGTNVASRRIRIHATPNDEADLLVTNARLGNLLHNHYETLAFYPGQPIRTWATVENRGGASSPSTRLHYYLSVDAEFSTNDIFLGQAGVPPLEPGEQHELYHALPLPSMTNYGYRYLVLMADGDESSEEYNEENNLAFRFFNLRENRADHRMMDLSSPGFVLGEAPVTIVGRVNGVSAGTTSEVGLYLSEDSRLDVDDLFVESFSANGEFAHTFSISSAQATGTYFLIANANDEMTVPEYDFSNNAQALRFFLLNDDEFTDCENALAQTSRVVETTARRGNIDDWRSQLRHPFELVLYPNPASEFLEVSLEISEPADRLEIELLDAMGKQLHYAQFIDVGMGTFQRSINLTRLPAGMYTVRITDGKSVESRAFAVKR